ncbi:32229_t:CDS:1, partial [Gigaspora margarita]
AKCTGYDLFVNLVKPDICRFCIRCCKNATSAQYSTGKSEASCELIIPGTYSKEKKTSRWKE